MGAAPSPCRKNASPPPQKEGKSMKTEYKIAALLTALFLIPIFAAQAGGTNDFEVDRRLVLQGMNRSWLQGYEPRIANNTLSLALPIRSGRAEGPIQTELIPADESLSPFKPQSMTVKTSPNESGLYAVRMNLELYPDRKNGDYACTLRITGQTKDGVSLRTDIPYTLRIRDGAPGTETMRMETAGLRSDFKVGEDGEIRFILKNPCRTVIFETPILHITDPSGEIIPRDVDVAYLPDLNPGESREVQFAVTVLNKAAVAPHTLRFDWTWKALGQEMSQSETYTLPVTQEIRLEQGGLKMASSVIAGDSVTLTLPLMNMGKADIINVLATVTLPGVTDRQSVLVGTIAPGETRQAQITLTPGKDLSGDYEGSLNVEGTDHDGNPASFSMPVHLTVEKYVKVAEADDPAAKENDKPPCLICGLAGGCGFLLLLLLLQGFLLRKKIHRLEEDKL